MSICSWFCRSLFNQVGVLEVKVAQLESQLAAIRNSTVMALDSYVTVQTTGLPRIVFSGVNVQIVNGAGKTDSINGLGNFIVGYDAPQSVTQIIKRCSVGTGTVMTNDGPGSSNAMCTAVDDPGRPGQKGVLGNNQKTGSHNLVVGDYHMYSQYGGVVFGAGNTINMPWATVTGGSYNTAAGEGTSVSGGTFNLAGGSGMSVNGHVNASVSGGRANWAYGMNASISGGFENRTGEQFSSVSGGQGNKAMGYASHVSGGGGLLASSHGNEASGRYSSVLGGDGQMATLDHQTIPLI